MFLEPLRVLVTGAAGQISYSLLPMILSGQIFGEQQPIILHLLEIPAALNALNGVIMELEDCAFNLLRGIVATSDIQIAFKNIDVAFLVGAMPRRDGMERKHLLAANVKIFEEQGRALNDYAKKSVLVLVVGNPANTNCFICASSAPKISRKNFAAMTFLDQNRARAMIAKKHNTSTYFVRNAFIWGNHSSTQYPDASEAIIFDGKNVCKIADEANIDQWLKSDFIKGVQQRGAEVIKARKASSAMSAAKAAADHMKAWWNNDFDDDIVSMAVLYDGSEQDFQIPSDLVFSYPVRISNRQWFVAKDAFDYTQIKSQLSTTINELIEERNEAKTLCNL